MEEQKGMSNKKAIITTAFITVVFTTAFYLTPVGRNIHSVLSMVTSDMTFSSKIERMSTLVDKY